MIKIKHSERFVMKIIEESGKTLLDVKNQVNEYSGQNFTVMQAIYYLRHFYADDIRMILRFNTF